MGAGTHRAARGLIVLLTVAALLQTESTVKAAIACSGQHVLFAGEFSFGSTPGLDNDEGVLSTIRVENAVLCPQRTDPGNTSSAWSLIAESQGA